LMDRSSPATESPLAGDIVPARYSPYTLTQAYVIIYRWLVEVMGMVASRAIENKTHTIRVIVDRLESLPDVAQLEVLDFVEFLQTRQMQYGERRADDKLWGDFSLVSAMKGNEDEETSYTSADIIEPST